jgi:hypothetical protein
MYSKVEKLLSFVDEQIERIDKIYVKTRCFKIYMDLHWLIYEAAKSNDAMQRVMKYRLYAIFVSGKSHFGLDNVQHKSFVAQKPLLQTSENEDLLCCQLYQWWNFEL